MKGNEVYYVEEVRDGHQLKHPAYTCGHCTTIVMLRPDRRRPRVTCKACSRWLCEQSELCMADCTPMYSLAEDRFENAGKWGKFVPAIMAGVSTLAEAEKQKLIS